MSCAAENLNLFNIILKCNRIWHQGFVFQSSTRWLHVLLSDFGRFVLMCRALTKASIAIQCNALLGVVIINIIIIEHYNKQTRKQKTECCFIASEAQSVPAAAQYFPVYCFLFLFRPHVFLRRLALTWLRRKKTPLTALTVGLAQDCPGLPLSWQRRLKLSKRGRCWINFEALSFATTKNH